MNIVQSIIEELDRCEDVAKSADAAELMRYIYADVHDVAAATGLTELDVFAVVYGGADSDVERAVRDRLLGVIESAITATASIIVAIATNRFARVHGDGDIRIQIALPFFSAPIEGHDGSPIPASVLNFASAYLPNAARALGASRFFNQLEHRFFFEERGLEALFEFCGIRFEALPEDERAVWQNELSKIAIAR